MSHAFRLTSTLKLKCVRFHVPYLQYSTAFGQSRVYKTMDPTLSLPFFLYSVAVSLLMTLDEDLDAEAAIEKIRELKGPGAIQSVKVVTCLAQLFIKTQGPLDDISLDLINMIRVIRMTHVTLRLIN